MHPARILILLGARIQLAVAAAEYCPILHRSFVIFVIFCANLFVAHRT